MKWETPSLSYCAISYHSQPLPGFRACTKRKTVKYTLTCVLILSSMALLNASQGQDTSKVKKFDWSNFTLKGYGVVNYYNYNWDTDSTKRNEFDAERLNLYLGYHFSDRISFKSEIEFEHGGTGVTKEFDKFEEFGEFETEVEAGGEIKLEQAHIYFELMPWLNIRVGRLKVYMGLASKMDEPIEYATTHRQEMENALIPLGWYENGLEVSGRFGKKQNWEYKLYLVSGLDGTGFSSRNWIKRGYQTRFESVFADAVAFAGRVDYHFDKNNAIGISSYIGNSTPNRPKKDLQADAYVSITDFHFNFQKAAFKLRGMALYGTLQNAEQVSQTNRNLSNNLNVKRTPVGSAALGLYIEGAYNIFSLWRRRDRLDVFARYDYYDSMFEVKGEIFDNPRWERSVITGGLNYFPHKKIVLKVQYSYRTLGLAVDNLERTFSMGIGFEF